MAEAEIVQLGLSAHRALKMIREIAAESGNIVVIRHAKDRRRQRKISRSQIEACVRKGTIQEGPFMNSHGNWQVSMFRHAAGQELTCVVAIDWPSKVIVITTF